ncbi:MAG TPA: PaaI family thioesterase [Xanthobacteraceae bacterium]|nr:PaaI family thioesterase [Xanthobacteraceae bacterium]
METPEVPPEFSRSRRSSGYLDLIGPIQEAGEGADYRLGLRVDARHVNSRGLCHGGVLAALADVHLGRMVALSASPPLPLVTIHLDLDYLAPAKLGAWLEASGRVDRMGRTLAHASGVITADGAPVLRCAAVFQVVGGGIPGRGENI